MPPKIKNLILGLSCSAVTLILLGGMHLAWFQNYLTKLKNYKEVAGVRIEDYQDPEHPVLTQQQFVNVGTAHELDESTPQNSFIFFPKEKPPETIRIGFFGCSRTRGAEAAKGHDFPSFVQERFRQNGMDHVEVINFGVGSYGIHQAYLLWDYAGRDYDLDYVVFNLYDFHTERDTSFIHTNFRYRPIHARFVLKGDNVELVEVLGENRLEAARNYFKIFPDWKYLRYDRQAPMFLRALIPIERKLKQNLFYYRLDLTQEEESLRIYSKLFGKVASEAPQLIVIANDELGRRLSEMLFAPNLSFLRTEVEGYKDTLLHEAPGGHYSAAGNRLYADEVFSFLTGGPEAPLQWVVLTESQESTDKAIPFQPQPLNRYIQGNLELDGNPVASFSYIKRFKDHVTKAKVVNFKKHEIQSLLEVPSLDGHYLALPFRIEDKMSVSVEFEIDGEKINRTFGHLKTKYGLIGRIDYFPPNTEKGLRLQGQGWKLTFKKHKEFRIDYKANTSLKNFKIKIGDYVALKQTKNNGKTVRFRRESTYFKDWIMARVRSGQYLNIDKLEASQGFLTLALTLPDGTVERYPTHIQYNLEPFNRIYQQEVYPHKVLSQ